MEWLNEPASWQRTGDVLTVSVDPGTDFWRETGYGYIRDSGHVYGEVLAGDLDVSVRMRCVLEAQYDQAGVMIRADEQTWLKTGVEFFEGRPRLSTVLTLGRSSWMVTDLPEGTDDIGLRVSRRGDAVEVRYQIGDGQAELAALVYMPPGADVLAGVMAAAPEGPGFRVTFQDLRIAERDWSESAEDWAGEPAWAGDGGDAAPWPGEGDAAETDVPGDGPAPGWDGPEPAPAWDGEEPGPPWDAAEPAPAWDGGQEPAPARDNGQEPAPAWDDGQEPAPAWDDGQEPAPARDSRQEPAPAWDGGQEPAPAWDDSAQEQRERPGWAGGALSEDHPSWPAGDPPVAFPGEDDPDWPKKLGIEDGPGWGTELAGEDGPGDTPAADAPGHAPATDALGHAPATDVLGDAPAAAAPPGSPAADAPGGVPARPEEPEPDRGAWAPAPVLEDAVADWDRLAAGVQAGRPVTAERWTAQTDADVANEWPGPPLPAARRAVIHRGLAAASQPASRAASGPPAAPGRQAGEGASPAGQASPAEPGPPPGAEPPGGQASPEPAPAGPKEAAHAKPRKAPARPPVDVPAPPDPADEWISLLTADPADE
jgi:regulation of enolase protein 1 (concanavalin A-like superfamily)